MFGYTMHRLTGFWALLFIFIGIGFTAQAQTVTGSDTLFIEGGSWEFFDFSSEMAFTIADTGSFDADIRGSSNEGVNFGQEFSSAVRDSAIQLLGMGSVDTVTSAPAWKETGTWVTTSWESTGFQPIQVGQLWAVYTAEGHYAVMEITALPDGDFGSSFAFDYVYQTDGSRFFDGSGEPVATAPTTNPADPMPRDTADIVSIYGDTYNSLAGVNYNPDWGQSGINDVDPSFDPGTGNPVLAYPNFNYQGTDFNGSFDLSNMDYVHIDIWVAEGTDRMVKFTPVDNSGNGPGEVLVEVPVTPGSWNSVDLPKSAFTDMSWESVFQLKFDGQFNADGSANTEPFDIYVDNVFFWKEASLNGDILVANGDFEAGDDGSWYGSGLNILTDGGNSYNFVDVTVAGNPWDVNLSQDVELTPGAYYELTFDAVTSDGNTRIMSAGIGLSQDPFYASTDDVMLTDTMQTFTLGLFASDATTGTDFGNDTSRVIFDMGADLGVVEIDNVSLVEAEAPIIELTTIAAAKDSSDGTLVKVQGIAITPSLESDSRTSFFIQDEGQGLNIFNFGTPSKEIEAGDLVEVTGEMETFNGLREILVSDIEADITVLSSGNAVPEPRVITYEEFTAASFPDTDTANIQGTLVRINDLSTDPSEWPADEFASSTNVQATTSADSAVAIRLLAQTEAIGVFPPTNFDLIGVIGTFNGAQMLPRFASDIIGDYPDVELNFQVDMSVQELAGNFDPATDTISVTGVFDGWDASANMMTEIDTSGFYEATVSFPLDGPVPQTYAYKFTIVGDDGSITWESGDDSQITVTEEDFNGTNYVTSNTIPDGVPFFDGITVDDIFLEQTDVVFEVDLRPAYYYIEDNGQLDPFGEGQSVSSVDWVIANGPLIAGNWDSWGLTQGEAEAAGLAFVDDGTSGDAVAGDSIFTLTKSYSPGDEVEGAFKLGVNGYDNEADFAIDHYLRIDESNFVSFIFGAIQQGDFLNDGIYDEYILETSEGPVVVRSGGTEGDMTNIIFDGDFTSDVLPDSWTFFEGEGAVADFSVIDNEAAVTNISGAGGATWHLQLIQLLSPEQKDMLTVGETYEISFDARSSVDGRPFRLFFGEDGGAFTGLAVVDTVANTAMQTYTYYTTLIQIFDNMKLGFELGLSNDDFFVDNVSMTRVEGVAEPLFGSNDVVGFLGETNELSFDLVELGSETIESFEFELTYDPTLVDITVPDQFGTLAENFTVEVNAETPGTILVSAAGTQGITDTGTLFVFDVLGLDNGEGSLEFTNVVYNETYVPGFSSALSIFEFICGDVTGDGQISAMDASWVLRHTVKLAPQYPLVGADSSAADVTGNGWISAFDASQILKYNVGLPAIFSCSESQAKAAPLAINAEWDYTPPAETQSIISMPIKISEINAELTAAQIEVPIAEGLAFKGLRNTPENWQVTTNVNDGTVYISLFGVEGIQQELLGALEFEVLNNSRPLSVSASVTLNENAPVQLKEVNLFELPSEFELSQNYPNPFNPTTQIKYSVPHDAKVQLTVYNLLGQKVAELVNEQKSPGKYTISWDAGNNASGVYMYRLAAGNKVFTKKMMLIK